MSIGTQLGTVVRLVRGLLFFGVAFCLFVAYAFAGGGRVPSTPRPSGRIVFCPLLGGFLCGGATIRGVVAGTTKR